MLPVANHIHSGQEWPTTTAAWKPVKSVIFYTSAKIGQNVKLTVRSYDLYFFAE